MHIEQSKYMTRWHYKSVGEKVYYEISNTGSYSIHLHGTLVPVTYPHTKINSMWIKLTLKKNQNKL
jgi:hypothetical protein